MVKYMQIHHFTLQYTLNYVKGHNIQCEKCGMYHVLGATVKISTLWVGTITWCMDCDRIAKKGNKQWTSMKLTQKKANAIKTWMESCQMELTMPKPAKKQWLDVVMSMKSNEED